MILVHVVQVKSTNNVMENDLEIKSVSIVGTGKLAHALLVLFQEVGFPVEGIWGRNTVKAQQLANKFQITVYKSLEEIKTDWILVSVSDNAITAVLEKLPEDSQVSITAGSFDVRQHKNLSIFYPLQTFDEHLIDFSWKGVPIILDGEPLFLLRIQRLCKAWEMATIEMEYSKREKLHLIAVFFNNFSNHILYKAHTLSESFEIDSDIFNELINRTFSNFKLNKKFNNQTGPAVRGDSTTLNKHRQLLSASDLAVYNVLTESIIHSKNELQGKTQ